MALKTILIVEDDPDISENLQQLFEGEGYPVLLAENGLAALNLLKMSSIPKPGLIFLDLMMPVMDGSTFLLELRRNHPKISADTPIFIITAKGGAHQLPLKATGILKKPLNLDELCKIAAQYCDPGDECAIPD